VSSLVLQRITRDVKSSCHYSVIVDETSDRISRAEQVSLCLRYVVEGETRETFAGFFATESTEGEVFYQFVKKSITNLNLLLTDIVGECFDGAANMSGCHKGVASRMKECSPQKEKFIFLLTIDISLFCTDYGYYLWITVFS
jgi:hypothetical protein